MENTQVSVNQPMTAKRLFDQENVKAKFTELLGKKAQGFITSVLQIVASNDLLSKAEPTSIYQAAAVAATLDLPLNNNLGFAYIVPYNARQKDGNYKQVAQFQIGYKGFIQLAQRSGQVKKIYASEIYNGQIISENPLEGYVFDFSKKGDDTVVGYAARIELINGFESVLYMQMDKIKAHGVKYSQTFKKGFGLWKDDFDAMAKKTVVKLLISRYAPLSIDMQNAIVFDQGVVKDVEKSEVEYVDHEEVKVELEAHNEFKESQRVMDFINDSTDLETLTMAEGQLNTEELREAYKQKQKELSKNK
jgi:recombination protein RecT